MTLFVFDYCHNSVFQELLVVQYESCRVRTGVWSGGSDGRNTDDQNVKH